MVLGTDRRVVDLRPRLTQRRWPRTRTRLYPDLHGLAIIITSFVVFPVQFIYFTKHFVSSVWGWPPIRGITGVAFVPKINPAGSVYLYQSAHQLRVLRGWIPGRRRVPRGCNSRGGIVSCPCMCHSAMPSPFLRALYPRVALCFTLTHRQ